MKDKDRKDAIRDFELKNSVRGSTALVNSDGEPASPIELANSVFPYLHFKLNEIHRKTAIFDSGDFDTGSLELLRSAIVEGRTPTPAENKTFYSFFKTCNFDEKLLIITTLKTVGIEIAEENKVAPKSITSEQIKAASYVPPSRHGKRALAGYFSEETLAELKSLAALQQRTTQSLMDEALGYLFAHHSTDLDAIRKIRKDRQP